MNHKLPEGLRITSGVIIKDGKIVPYLFGAPVESDPNNAFGPEVMSVQEAREREAEVVKAAQSVMDTLEKYGPSIVPHLMDTDDNAGQRLRNILARYKGGE